MKEILVVKCGGSILARLGTAFFQSLRGLQQDYQLVVVHGGGPEIDELLQLRGIPVEKKNGLRVTSAEVLEAVQMSLCGLVNKQLTAKLKQHGMPAFGMAGCDGDLLLARQLDEELGFVGEVVSVNAGLLHSLIGKGLVPVIAPVGIDEAGQLYNINGDTAAGAVASALGAKQLLFVTDVPGVLQDGKMIETADKALLDSLIEQEVITGGMIPKVQAAVASLQGDVERVVIVDGLRGFIQDGCMQGTAVTKGVNV
ncbi:acetylglutamate kinase [Ectobacillus ponti]|uniref:Acetylglutamate kinase n=1 Tax=Ectobacillus ponti TaxID=2961894 RepID=A0AA41X1Q7_9BACI|nr:acetylglutamate kinase [Ectobacillus ponti]MCP8966992.1 acetylglutamate kinase [Ectobacillus ponti]